MAEGNHEVKTLIVTGSRDWTDQDTLCYYLDQAHTEHNFCLVVQGGARGADEIAFYWARSRGIECETVPADWDTWGHSAGPRRNVEMLEAHPDAIVYAFPKGESKGTRHCIREAKKRGMAVREIEAK